jgi:hypothetical protein
LLFFQKVLGHIFASGQKVKVSNRVQKCVMMELLITIKKPYFMVTIVIFRNSDCKYQLSIGDNGVIKVVGRYTRLLWEAETPKEHLPK